MDNITTCALQPDFNGAFLSEGFGKTIVPTSTTSHLLEGLRLAVKDVYDIQGFRTGAGNPIWYAEQSNALKNAIAVEQLLAAGTTWTGKTVTDELTYSLAGINVHYGTPANPVCPDRIPGGSSSGSAVAVAADIADIALGTDCGGSVRLPASYCGIWGMRPTHGRIASNGCLTLAHSFDTVGWFAQNGQHLEKILCVLAHTQPQTADPIFIIPTADAFLSLLDISVSERFKDLLEELQEKFAYHVFSEALPLKSWAQAFRVLQASEAWLQHGQWVSQHKDDLGKDVRLRFEHAKTINEIDVSQAQHYRREAISLMARLLSDERHVLILPTVPTVAPSLAASAQEVDDIRSRSQQLLCIAGLAGLPQVSLPWIAIRGAPLGLSLIGAQGCDEIVIGIARQLSDWLTDNKEA